MEVTPRKRIAKRAVQETPPQQQKRFRTESAKDVTVADKGSRIEGGKSAQLLLATEVLPGEVH
jgi:hypothetical protein